MKPSAREIAPSAPLPTLDYERRYWSDNVIVAGIDEVGRGALAGPVVAAAVVFHPSRIPEGIDDSKRLTAERRVELAAQIIDAATSYSFALVDNARIDSVNILQATFDAMHGAIGGLTISPGRLLIDGNRFRSHEVPHTTIVRGDAASVSIAAASIIAKVVRDAWMREHAHERFPVYGFSDHKGYGTPEHRRAIVKYGATVLHRHSFLSKVLAADPWAE